MMITLLLTHNIIDCTQMGSMVVWTYMASSQGYILHYLTGCLDGIDRKYRLRTMEYLVVTSVDFETGQSRPCKDTSLLIYI